MENFLDNNDDFLNEYPQMLNMDDDDDDIFGSSEPSDPEPKPAEEPTLEPEPQNVYSDDDDTLTSYLKTRGISDPTKILFQSETGDIEEVDFNSLSKEELLDLLHNLEDNQDLSDDEVDTINFLRLNNISLSDFVKYQQLQAIEEYKKSQEVVASVNQLSDQELFVIDLKHQYPELTDEELAQELEDALDNEELFNKKMTKLRADYVALEQQEAERLKQETENKDKEEYQNLVNTMVSVAQNTNDFYGLELDNNDKEEILQFLLTKDVNGNSEFSKILNDPQALFNLAWYAVKGPEAFATLHSYYKKLIDTARSGRNSSQSPKVVRKSPKEKGEDPYGLRGILK